MSREFGYKILGVYEEVPVDQIVIDEGRRPLDELHVREIQTSIASKGLINPITLYHPEGAKEYTLLAGLHRFTAIKNLKMRLVSARVYDYALSAYELKAIEVYENLHRKDLSDVERAQQTNELHELMRATHGPKIAGSQSSGHSLKDTARLLGKSVGSVHSDVKIANAIKALPELGLQNAASKSDALRMLQRFASVMGNRATVANMQPSEVTKSLVDSYIVGDFFTEAFPQESYAFIECDPPYGIDLVRIKQLDSKLSLQNDYNEIPEVEYTQFLFALTERCYALAAQNSWIVLWYGPQWYSTCMEALRDAGFAPNIVPGVWKKGTAPGQSQSPNQALGNSYESFIYARKGSPSLHIPGRSNVYDFAPVTPTLKIHPTERPISLMMELIRTFTWPDTNVLCPFLGSGNTIRAAANMQLECEGCDLSEEYKNAFVARLLGKD